MKLFYTTVTGYDVEQPNTERSLGGYKSATAVVNSDFNNLFDELSVMSIKNGRDEYRAIIAVNDSDKTVENFKIKLQSSEGNICSFKIAAIPLVDSNKYGQYFMENVSTQYSKPFRAEFVDMNGVNEITIDTIPATGEVGVWFDRHIDKELATIQYETVCKPDPTDPNARRYVPVESTKEEAVDVTFTWDYAV